MPELDSVPYCDLPIPETSVQGLHATAGAWGVNAAPPERARVLELGCAHGVNLMPMASRYPRASFVGVDLDADAISEARRRAAASGLTNIRFLQADFAGDVAEPESVDYVIAHGVYSWVDAEHRTALLRVTREVLVPGGVGYVSYNALPGASVRLALGDALRAVTNGVADVEAQSRRMRDALRLLGDGSVVGSVSTGLLEAELATLDAQPDAYLHHEFLGAEQHACGVTAFCGRARDQALQYLDELSPVGMRRPDYDDLCERVASLASDRVHAQALIDVAVSRSFRATLLVRDDEAIATARGAVALPVPPLVVPEYPRVSLLTRFEAVELGFVTTAAHRGRAMHPLHAAVIAACDGSRDLGALVDALGAKLDAGDLVLHTENGDVAPPEHAKAGLPTVIGGALEQLASAGLFVS